MANVLAAPLLPTQELLWDDRSEFSSLTTHLTHCAASAATTLGASPYAYLTAGMRPALFSLAVF